VKKNFCGGRLPLLRCTFCGAEIAAGETYWSINGAILCGECLPTYAREDYRTCSCVRGEERPYDAL
jgi:hypothetical protein